MSNRDIMTSMEELATHYSNSLGVVCSIIDLKQRSIIYETNHIDLLPCLSLYQCLDVHLQNAHLAQRFGYSYIYFCRHELLYWISPILIDGVLKYALVSGPVLALTDDDSDDLPIEFQMIPKIDIGRIHSMAEVLRIICGHISGVSVYKLLEERETLGLHSKLFEYIEDTKSKAEQNTRYYPLEKEEELQEAIRWGNRKTAQQVMNELLGMIFFIPDNTIEKIKIRIIDLLSLLARAAVKGGAPEKKILEINVQCQRTMRGQHSFEEMARRLSTTLHQYIDLVFAFGEAGYKTPISKAIHYIHRNYGTKIKLTDVAQEAQLSANYLSRLFRQTMGITFTRYVNQIRIEHARRLLWTSDLSLIEIAGMVGFEDQSYFSKIFKEITTISPNEYRTNRGRVMIDQTPKES